MKSQESLEYKYTAGRGEDILERIQNQCGAVSDQDIVNDIVLWKINRRVKITEEISNDLQTVKILKSTDDLRLKDILKRLLETKGIRLPMASTILHFYNSDLFPIIDQRAYRELYKDKGDYKEPTKTEAKIKIYTEYVQDCRKKWEREYKNEGIPFAEIDKILYQLDKNAGNRVKR